MIVFKVKSYAAVDTKFFENQVYHSEVTWPYCVKYIFWVILQSINGPILYNSRQRDNIQFSYFSLMYRPKWAECLNCLKAS